MDCPHCHHEMEAGFFQGEHVLWAKRIHNFSLRPEDTEFRLKSKPLLGCCCTGYICRWCNQIIFDYSEVSDKAE